MHAVDDEDARPPSRRTFLTRALATIATLATPPLAHAARTGAVSGFAQANPHSMAWIAGIDALCAGVKDARLTSQAWRRRAQRLTRRTPAEALIDLVDVDAFVADPGPDEEVEPQQRLRLPAPSGLDGLAFSAILSHVAAGAAVAPHGHRNMVSMHVLLRGAVRLRQYDRVSDDPAHVVIRPRADRVCGPGDTAAISADRGNVHWFRGLADTFLLIVAAYDLDVSAGPTGRDYLDPLAADRRADGTLRAPRLTEAEARRRYA